MEYRSTLNDVIQRAQETLDLHPVDASTGRCQACGVLECPFRAEAVRVFYRWYVVLPSRRPGATRPELVGTWVRKPLVRVPPLPAGGRRYVAAPAGRAKGGSPRQRKARR